MATKITNCQCPACTGPLHFSAGSGKLECEFCGSSFEVAEIEKLYEEKEKAAAAALEAEEKPEVGRKKRQRPKPSARTICRRRRISTRTGARMPEKCGLTSAPPAARS